MPESRVSACGRRKAEKGFPLCLSRRHPVRNEGRNGSADGDRFKGGWLHAAARPVD